jgi:UDP-N-acetylglucosamine 1-carboxyvinyltransferase
MSKIIVEGRKKLKGEVVVSGNKNSALKLMAAAAMLDGRTVLRNIPIIGDVDVMAEIMNDLGIKISGLGTSTLIIDSSGLNTHVIKRELSGKIRTAPLLIAALLHKYGKAEISTPGGCSLGRRLLFTHFNMLRSMGGIIDEKDSGFVITWKPKSVKHDVFLEEASVTATELGILIAAKVARRTIISDAACEPHIEDLSEMLNLAGAEIKGAGTNTLEIRGVKDLKAVRYSVSGDHVEAGSWAIATAVTGGDVTIKGINQNDLRMICAYFNHLGVKHKFVKKNSWRIYPSKLVFDGKLREFQTRPWPGFPTDLMSPLIVLATQAKGTVICHDWMYEWRIFFVDDLISMGAKIIIADPHRVIVSGPSKLFADDMVCKDIRAGMAIVIAALAARGKSTIDNVEVIERGYEDLLGKLRKIGASIDRIE